MDFFTVGCVLLASIMHAIFIFSPSLRSDLPRNVRGYSFPIGTERFRGEEGARGAGECGIVGGERGTIRVGAACLRIPFVRVVDRAISRSFGASFPSIFVSKPLVFVPRRRRASMVHARARATSTLDRQ